MWERGWRERAWLDLDQKWDIIIIGGGITGAGIFHEAVQSGYQTLLIEQHDFASGTSSRSSKLVHGGFRYLKNGQIRLTMESVHEREHLLREARGLVTPLGFLLANYAGDSIPAWVFGAGLITYDLLAMQWGHRHYDTYDMHDLCPSLNTRGLEGGYRYFDAQTDDARLVLRLIQESTCENGLALNYTSASHLIQLRNRNVCGIVITDQTPENNYRKKEVQGSVIINATGAWADDLRKMIGCQSRLRKLRGSHIILSSKRLPLTRAVSFLHPNDNRPVFAFPWEGVTLVGTTDVDLDQPLETHPKISVAEVEYLLEAIKFAFPSPDFDFSDIQATFAGVRPVINTGKSDPSKESREHILLNDHGMLTVTGGKLTTFRLMAREAIKKIRSILPDQKKTKDNHLMFQSVPDAILFPKEISPATCMRLTGRYGQLTPQFLTASPSDEFEKIMGTQILWSELRWAARAEAVVHLEDLLLRRVRLGLLLPYGGKDHLLKIRDLVQAELGWDEQRWFLEERKYKELWEKCYYSN